ncbi:DEAD/DEAH box helicase [Paenibacillus gansuensis]|uniref:SNF2 helicase associated domain-containing protein n=1 Tax=Paenibacillus gansuensis TaxID=306542 RepID=A0ABW5P9A9_9BACL
MNYELTGKGIKSLCGTTSYNKGASYYRAGKVRLAAVPADERRFEGIVTPNRNSSYQVKVELLGKDEVQAECTCPSLESYRLLCSHAAAVLLSIQHRQQYGHPSQITGSRTAAFPDSSAQVSSQLLGLFARSPKAALTTADRALFETRTSLQVEIRLSPVPQGQGTNLFQAEVSAGLDSMVRIADLRAFLLHMERKEAYRVSSGLIYQPELHTIDPRTDAVLRRFAAIAGSEAIYEAPLAASPAQVRRPFVIPPMSWEVLYPLLTSCSSVTVEHQGTQNSGLRPSSQAELPLQFRLDYSPVSGYSLSIDGLNVLTVFEGYKLVLSGGECWTLSTEQSARLAGMKALLEETGESAIPLQPAQMEAFMDQAVPGLMKLGQVVIAPSVSERMDLAPLKAKLYLDRVRDRLLAGLEFVYGDLVINPLADPASARTDRILMRSGEEERRILEWMELGGFTRTEAGYFMTDEETEFSFLYTILPELEKLVQVYATSAVKERLFQGNAVPLITVDADHRNEWLEITFDIRGIPEAEIREVIQSVEEKRRYHKLRSGALLPIERRFEEVQRILKQLDIYSGGLKELKAEVPVLRGLRLWEGSQEDGGTGIVSFGRSVRQLMAHLRNPDLMDIPVPETLSSTLREYQKYGFQWMKMLARYRFGGILADDMGLGKTLQSIAFLLSELEQIRSSGQPALIVCPASLLYNWLNELKKFAPEIKAAIVEGSSQTRGRIISNPERADVLITSYPLLRKDVKFYAGVPFHTLLLDEAQAFKNVTTQTARAVKQLRARHRFALTGTPVENRLDELWSIFDAVFPELFPDLKEFQTWTAEQAARRSRPFLLRRLKTDVLKELPEKIESLQSIGLLPEQKRLYVSYLAKLQKETLKHLSVDGYQKHKIRILAGLTRLRQICCHPGLFVEGYQGSSAKFEQLLQIIEDCRSAGKRPLIFSQFTGMLDLIGRELGYRGIPFFYLDGQTPSAERVDLCRRFNEGERELFLISLKAGGTGLNLTGADTVILYDLWWNPAVEEQAADRAYRMGQTKVVHVIRLVAQGTVEEKMYALQQRKKHLIDEVLRPGEESHSAWTEEDIREVLMI